MRLILDFSNARQGLCHSYTGVMARIDGDVPVAVTITHDGCHRGTLEGPTTSCEDPTIDSEQAWAVAMLLTRRESVRPSGPPFYDYERRHMSFPLTASSRPRIT